MRSPLAICWRMSALGLRRPRSIWLRYGLDTPAFWASWRIEIFACSRCSLMYSPMEFTFTLAIPQCATGCLQLQTASKRSASTRRCLGASGDAEERTGFSRGHRRPLGQPGQLGGALHQLGVAGDRAPAGEGQRVLHADPQVAAGAEGAQ